jgi:hypothetical protein
MINTTLTDGQQRVREIIYQMLPEYQNLMKESDECDIDFFCAVRKAFASDPVITSDPCLCQSLFKPALSPEYVDYLRSISDADGTTEIIDDGEYLVALDKFFYDNSPMSELPVYRSDDGDQWHSTFSSLFEFAEGKDLFRPGWESEYFAEDGILKVEGWESHRSMACVLWGQHLIKPGTLHVIKSKSDPELHSALIFIEKLLREGVEEKYELWFMFKSHACRHTEINIKKQLLAEAQEIKEFYRSITPDEITSIRSFLSSGVHRSHFDSYCPWPDLRFKFILSIDALLKIVRESRAIKSRNIFQQIISKISRPYKHKSGKLSIFELWFFGLP